MNCTSLEPTFAHYDLQLAELTTRPASHACSIGPCVRAT